MRVACTGWSGGAQGGANARDRAAHSRRVRAKAAAARCACIRARTLPCVGSSSARPLAWRAGGGSASSRGRLGRMEQGVGRWRPACGARAQRARGIAAHPAVHRLSGPGAAGGGECQRTQIRSGYPIAGASTSDRYPVDRVDPSTSLALLSLMRARPSAAAAPMFELRSMPSQPRSWAPELP